MRLLVISDSHRKSAIVDRIIRSEPNAKHIFFLGDITSDIEYIKSDYTDRIFHIVKGNCDGFCSYPDYDIVRIENTDIFYIHGHNFDVNYGIDRLYEKAAGSGCKIALYGHTHIANITYRNGIYIINPGSPSCPREGAAGYAVIDIIKGGILPYIAKI